MRFAPVIAITLFAVFWALADATTTRPISRSEIIAKSEFIGVVRVTTGRAVDLLRNGEEVRCGGVYRASVLDGLLGDEASIEFFADESLRIGERYVVFLTRGDRSSQKILTTNSAFLPFLERNAEIAEACDGTYRGLKAIAGYTSAFLHRREVTQDDHAADEWWVEYTVFAFYGDNDIEVLRFEAVDVLIHSKDGSIAVTNDQLLQSLVPDYPNVRLAEMMMKWDDYREAIVRELDGLKPDKPGA